MIYPFQKHLVFSKTLIKEALTRFNELAADAIIFIVDSNGILLGSLTDGDVRRGLLNGLTLETSVDEFIQDSPKLIQRGHYTIHEVISYRNKGYKVLPVVDSQRKVVNLINFRNLKSYLPVDVVIMAGGRGERLRPLTDAKPKSLLIVGDKSILSHNLDRLIHFGIDDFWISLGYLGQQIEDNIGDGSEKGVCIKYIYEKEALGTIGSVSMITEFEHDYVLLTNSDILTNLDYEQFFLEFINSGADLTVATIPYTISVPYAILEKEGSRIKSFKEKPTYTYLANAGIYLMKKEICKRIPSKSYFNATDLIELLLADDCKVTSYPMQEYWLDIGKHEDFSQAQEDIKYLKF